jgi:hypothetical protein
VKFTDEEYGYVLDYLQRMMDRCTFPEGTKEGRKVAMIFDQLLYHVCNTDLLTWDFTQSPPLLRRRQNYKDHYEEEVE